MPYFLFTCKEGGEEWTELIYGNDAEDAKHEFAYAYNTTVVSCSLVELAQLPADMLLEELEMRAEAENYHSLQTMYRPLYKLIENAAGAQAAHAVLVRLFDEGGLQNLHMSNYDSD